MWGPGASSHPNGHQGGANHLLWEPHGHGRILQVWSSVCLVHQLLRLPVVWGLYCSFMNCLLSSWYFLLYLHIFILSLNRLTMSNIKYLFLSVNQFGRTEMILNCLNPKFSKKFVMDYYFEMVQRMKFCVYDIDNNTYDLGDDDFLGELECTLGQVSFIFKHKLWSFHHLLIVLRRRQCFVSRLFQTGRWLDPCCWRMGGMQVTVP